MTPAPLLRLAHVEKRYGDVIVLRNISFTVEAGELVGLIGPNGAGKSTLLRVAAGLVHPDAGTAVRERGAGVDTCCSLRYFGGEMTLPPGPPARVWADLITREHGITDRRRLGVLSRGSRQMVGLRAYLAPPRAALYLLDEPWEGLDPDAARWLSMLLQQHRQAGSGILVSSHRLHDLAGVCDRYVFLSDGVLHPFDTSGIEAFDMTRALFERFSALMASR